ncbi:MAG: hypothetical protein WCQ21_00060 [Verrucomicrobiota bacterium]|jgi:hypothetical protein
MTGTYANPRNELDQIVVDDKSKLWLRDNQLVPRTWEISDQEAMRIRSHRVGLRVFFSPAFTYDFSLYPVVNGGFVHLTFFDAELLNRRLLIREEAIAVILHELGHEVNKFASRLRDGSDERRAETENRCAHGIDEHDADDYARHCGFGNHLVNAFEKLRASGASYFNTAGIQERIDRINAEAPMQLHFIHAP